MTTSAAVVGCGDVSVVHFEAITALGIRLVAVVDTEPAGLQRAAAVAPGVPGFASVAEMLAAIDQGRLERPDVVHVTTPHHQHAEPTLALLAAGLHVIQEKPLANSLTAAQSIVDAAASSSARSGICFQNRYNASSQALKQVLEDGELGELLGGCASVVWARTPDYYQARPWRGRWDQAGGGLLINQAIHTLDLLQWFLGEPTEVAGSAATLRYRGVIEVEDSANAWFTHRDGISSTFVGSLTNAVHRDVEIEIYGSQGVATIADGLHLRLADGRTREVPERRAASGGRSYWGLSHQLFIEDFHARLDDAEPFWIGPEQAMASMRMLKAVYADSFPGSHHQ
ncbi:Gfo/Idh/MocA family oxidoreductase [Luteococcus peritonei]|uniref:Gfo/Idh/MocA family protein n=1 Tax=Luteococcus peritonei TaxID=88874 RepID=A0ABW4RY72_9ACTN